MATGTRHVFPQGEVIIRLDIIMADRKLDVIELAALIGATPVTIIHLISGKSKSMKVEMLKRLCTVLECKPNDLIELRSVNQDMHAESLEG